MRRALAICLGLAAALGCGSDREPPAKAAKADASARPQPAAAVRGKALTEPAEPPAQPPAEPPASPQFDSRLGGRFALAAAGLPHAPAEPREHGPTWQPPACELKYQFRVLIGNGDGHSRPSMTLIAGSWKARADEPGMILKNGEIRLAQLAGATQRVGESVGAGKLAEIQLKLNGHEWIEVDGPTALWSAYGPWTGLSKFFPAVPELGAAGSRATWHLLLYERSGSGRVEGRRGSLEVPDGVVLPDPEPSHRNPGVTVERWIDLDGTAAVVLRSWSEIDDRNSKSASPDLKVHEISQGRYVVLESGVLLHAELRERSTFYISGMASELAIDGEARLVRGCGGPVLPRVEDAPSGPERALDVVAQLRDRALAGEREQLTAMLDEELRTAEPEAAQCLVNAIERYGVASFGAPELPLAHAVRERKGRVELQVPARIQPDQQSASVRFVFAIDAAAITLAAIELRRGPDVLLHLEPGTPRIAEAGCSRDPE